LHQAARTGRAGVGADGLGFHLNRHPPLADVNRPMRAMRACDAMTCGDVRNADRPLGINETIMRLDWLQIAQESLLKERFRWSVAVVRDRIELSTFRFSGVADAQLRLEVLGVRGCLRLRQER
jgi:hypothetical protein